MLMELLYENASARPDDVAIVYRDERRHPPDLVERVERLAAGLVAEGIGPGDAVALLLPNDPSFVAELLRDLRDRRRGRAGQPGVQAGRAGLLLPPVLGAGRDQRRAQRGRVRADRGRVGAAGAGDHHELGARAGAHPRHADGARAGQARAPLAGRAARLPVLVGLHRPAEARGAHARAVPRRGGVLPGDGIDARTIGSSARFRSSTPTAWAAACSPRRAAAPRSCSSRTPTRSCCAASGRSSCSSRSAPRSSPASRSTSG